MFLSSVSITILLIRCYSGSEGNFEIKDCLRADHEKAKESVKAEKGRFGQHITLSSVFFPFLVSIKMM